MRYGLVLLMILAAPVVNAADSRPLSLAQTPAGFHLLIKDLRVAAKKKDANAIYARLAKDYYIRRDHGGTFDPKASAQTNFGWTFQLDNSKLRPEYKDYGWNGFSKRINEQKFERKKNGQICMPHGAMDKKPFPHGQLCFRKGKGGKWLIAGHINGGD